MVKGIVAMQKLVAIDSAAESPKASMLKGTGRSVLILSEAIQDLVRCPSCRSRLINERGRLCCTHEACGMQFPIVDGIPVLINDQNSVFKRSDFVSRKDTTFNLSRGRLVLQVDRLLPKLSRNVTTKGNYRAFAELLLKRSPNPVVLVIGGSILGRGMEVLASDSRIQLVETDVSFGPRTQVICDAHDLPFEINSFDGVVVQSVLQYLLEPARCVHEIK